MAKFQLTISSDYVKDWGVYEGVREVLQNALDANDAGNHIHVHHSPECNLLSISSFGVQLDRSVWLMGTTSKENTDARGHFGEGLKLGALSLVRAGRKLRIINDTEDWSCTLDDSKVFPGQQVLSIQTRKRANPQGAFCVQIECSAEEWDTFQSNFLHFQPSPTTLITDDVEILTDPEQRGRVYVKGILVETNARLAAGYNLVGSGIRTDRDRRMVNSFDFNWYTATAWLQALNQQLISPEFLLTLLAGDVQEATKISERYCCNEDLQRVADAWQQIHGEFAIPVPDVASAKEAGHFGRIGVISPKPVCDFFSDHSELSLKGLRIECRDKVSEVFAFAELNPSEQDNFELAIELIEPAAEAVGIPPISNRVQVVNFVSNEVLGVHRWNAEGDSSTIAIARRALHSLDETIRVLVHEVAHDSGDDGSVSHERTEGRIFSYIVSDLALKRSPLQRWQQRQQVAA